MSSNAPSAPITGADYVAIEEAVMETARGRWFLSEYARRNRATDTASVLEALGRLEQITGPLERPPEGSELIDTILTIIDDACAAPWQGISDRDTRAPQLRPSQASKGATAAIRRTAEKIREVAFELRETAKLEIYANALDLYCADLANAASLQESATSRLAELSGLLMAIENQLSGRSSSAVPSSQTEDQATRDSGSSGSENSTIAPTELPPSPREQTAMTGEEGESLLSGSEQASGAAKAQAPALLFVNPN